MYKGVGKQIVVIKNPESKIFEEAIFIIKDNTNTIETDFLNECERIIKGGNSFKTIKNTYNKNKISNFLLYTGLILNTLSILIILIAVM